MEFNEIPWEFNEIHNKLIQTLMLNMPDLRIEVKIKKLTNFIKIEWKISRNGAIQA